jgi:glycosyltransferase involved in cell wall biosynthesis
METWLFQTGEPLHVDAGNPRPMRAMNLANALVERGHRVVLWSAAFYHQEKRHRSREYARIRVSDALEVRLVPSRGYSRNIGPDRLLDHAQLALNLRRALAEERQAPDVGFVGYPPIEFAAVATRWLKSRGVPSLLDGKDQWPEIFVQRFPAALKPLARVAFWPYAHLGRRAMRDATGLTSMAGAFLDWMREFSGREPSPFDGVFPLSPTDSASSDAGVTGAFDWWAERGVRDDGRPRFMFVGSFSHAMDFGPVRAAAEKARRDGRDWQFVICGDGTIAGELRQMFAGLDNVLLPGWVDRPQCVALSRMSTAAIAPYRNVPDFQMSVPNKVIDYLLLGQPVLSPLLGEVSTLIDRFETGLRYDDGVEDSLYERLLALTADPSLQARLSQRARETYHRHFEGRTVYGNLAALLERLAETRHA